MWYNINLNPMNKCIRCGKLRVISSSWTEGNITYSSYVCPDAVCQKVVEQELKAKRDRLNTIKENSLKRRLINKRSKVKKSIKSK